MKNQYYKLGLVDGIPTMVRSDSGDYVLRDDHERQVEGLVSELAEKDKQLDIMKAGIK